MKFTITKKQLVILQYALAGSIIFWILKTIDLTKAGASFSQIAWWTIPVLVATTLLLLFLQGSRWWLLLRAFTDKISFSMAMSCHFSSIFYALVLPTGAAQEVLRTLLVIKKAGTAVSIGAAWICKITAVTFSMLFSIFGIIYLTHQTLPKGTIAGILSLFIVLLLSILLSFSKKITTPLKRLLEKFIPSSMMQNIEMIREGIFQYRTRTFELIITSLLSLLIQFIFIAGTALVIKGICGKFFFWECLAFMPLIEIISMSSPLTPNGIGVREALSALMFDYIGLSKEHLGVYITLLLLQTLIKLVGVIPVIYGAFAKKTNLFVLPRKSELVDT